MYKWRVSAQIPSGTLISYSDYNKHGLVSISDTKKFEKFCMSGLRQNGHFAVFLGYFKKVALGKVKVELLRPNFVWHSKLVF